MKDCYIFDIDGTLADITHRLHFIQETPKNWDAFFAACVDDPPIKHVCDLAETLSDHGKHCLVFISGRSDQIRDQTVEWIEQYIEFTPTLYMRKIGDYRADHVV